MDSTEKKMWHDRFRFTDPPFPSEWVPGALDYNFEDVRIAADLLRAMAPRIDLPRALLRYRYMVALAHMEHRGIPTDVSLYKWLQAHWDEIKARFIDDCPHNVFVEGSWNQDKFTEFVFEVLGANDWPRTDSGALITASKTMERMGFEYPEIEPIRKVKKLLDGFDRFELGIHETDEVCRAGWRPFASSTGRNQPLGKNICSNHGKHIRGLIQAKEGRVIVELDIAQEEFGIAAALSQDPAMMETYRSGDPYMTFAIKAGAAPAHATKQTHPEVRDVYKTAILALSYGSTGAGIARRLGQPHAEGALLLRQFEEVFHVYDRWRTQKRANARWGVPMVMPFGWRIQGGARLGWRTVDNSWQQASGAELMRAATVHLHEAGLPLVALIHDAFVFDFDAREWEEGTREAERIIGDASESTLYGRLRLRTERKVVPAGERLLSSDAMPLWKVMTRG
jgi:DNA polymerase I-like protein with 3'-5' exonuclease and polymerase domains